MTIKIYDTMTRSLRDFVPITIPPHDFPNNDKK